MMCSAVQKRLVLYLASELSMADADRVTRHLGRCSACAREAEALEEVQGRLEAALATDREPSAALETRVLETVRGIPVTRRPARTAPRLIAIAASACIVLLTAVIGSRYLPQPGRQVLDQRLMAAAFRASVGRVGPSVPMGSAEASSRRLSGETRFSVKVVVPEGTRALHADTLPVGRASLAALRYEWKGRTVVLFQADASRTSAPPARAVPFKGETYHLGSRNGVGFVAWRSGAANCMLMAEAPPEMILPLASDFCEAMEKS